LGTTATLGTTVIRATDNDAIAAAALATAALASVSD